MSNSNNVDLPLKDRMKAAFLKEGMADIHFSERIPGHKLLLATASEGFCGMLYGHFEVPETIDVDDSTPEAFKIMLLYIYTDEVDLTPDNAFPLLYLARKYMLNNLVTQVSKYIDSAYSGESVAKVLPHLHLLEGEHAERMQVSLETNSREVLGKALKLIRFPLMSVEEFSSGPAKSGLLSDKKKLELYKWYGRHASQDLTTFSSTPRKRHVLSCTRFDASSIVNINDGSWLNCRVTYFFHFTVSTRVRFHGVAFFGRKDESNVYEVTLSLLHARSREALATTQTNVTTDASEDTYKVLFDRPVSLAPRTLYKVAAVSIGPDSMYAENGRREVTCDYGNRSATFTFTKIGHLGCNVCVRGHIPTIYFSFV